MDMTAYVKPGTEERIGIVNDFVSPELTAYIKRLIEEYNTIPWVDSKCGYACSDHTVCRPSPHFIPQCLPVCSM